MAKAEIHPGICGMTTIVKARMEGSHCTLSIESECESVQCLAAELVRVDPLREISFRGEGPLTLRLAPKHIQHPSCPVPCGIIKAVEVEASLALPSDVTIKLSKSEQ